jgi:hypothetical protein
MYQLYLYSSKFHSISESLYLQDRLGKEEGLPLEDQHTRCLHCRGHRGMTETLCPVDDGLVVCLDATFL